MTIPAGEVRRRGRLVLSRAGRLPLVGPGITRGTLVRVCELLGLEPREVRTIELHPTQVSVETYCSRADGTRYMAPDRKTVATFWRHHPVTEGPARPARPATGMTPRPWAPEVRPTPEQRAEWLSHCSQQELLTLAQNIDRMHDMLDRDLWLRNTLHEVLALFHERGHPGRPCLRTGWVPVELVKGWRDRLRS